MSEIGRFLEKASDEYNKEKNLLEFIFEPEKEVTSCRVLTYVNSLKNVLANYTINPIVHESSPCRSKIIAKLTYDHAGFESIGFRLLTSFAGPGETNKRISSGQKGLRECLNLELFGVEFDKEGWRTPTKLEQEAGYKAACNLSVPSGYKPRRR